MEDLRGPIQKFAVSMFSASNSLQPNGNMLFSPVTSSAGLLLIYLGSDGITRTEIEKALHLGEFGNKSSNEHDIQMAFRMALAALAKITRVQPGADDHGEFQLFRLNRLYLQKGIVLSDAFVERTRKLRAEIKIIDFQSDPEEARQEINAFVEESMDGKITNCFEEGSIDNSTQLLLANGICFRARWNVAFDRSKTVDLPFYPLNGSAVSVPMMRAVMHLPYAEDLKLNITYIEIPYVFNKASLIILLPKARNGLKNMHDALGPNILNRLHLAKRLKEVDLIMPRFNVRRVMNIKDALKKLGVKTLFTEAPNLSRMVPEGNVSLSAGNHFGYFSVDEEGTGAGDSINPRTGDRELSTHRGSIMSLNKSQQDITKKPIPVVIDHAFLFAVRHNKSGMMVCFGRLESVFPEKANGVLR